MLAGTGWSRTARAAAWIVLIGIGTFGGADIPRSAAIAAVGLAAPVALLAFVGTVVSIWRGPPVVEFAPKDGVRCDEQQSEPVRAYAQLRGMIGGAGHVHPARLAFPAISWAAALVAGVRGISPILEEASPSPVALAVAAAVGAWLFPSRAYWYREAMGGGAIVSPPEAMAELVAREMREDAPGIAVVHAAGQAAPILRGKREDPGPGVGVRTSRRRSRRFASEWAVLVHQGGERLRAAVLNVSDGGLALRCPEERPAVGDEVVVVFHDDGEPRSVRASVRWHERSAEQGWAVGLELRGDGGRSAWRQLVERAARNELSA